MKPLVPYLFFNGNCREAMDFYKHCFGGDLQVSTFGDAPMDMGSNKDDIMHAFLTKDQFSLMASDSPGEATNVGNNIQLSIDCQTKSEIETLFEKLSQDGKVVQPLADTFWGAHFGMLVDKFGVRWMLNYQIQK